jgi:predicted nuclease with TOPRIM domain
LLFLGPSPQLSVLVMPQERLKRKQNSKQNTEEKAAATEAVAERRVEVTKEASNVQQTVNRMPDDDVDRELRDTWKRPGGG